MRKHNHSAFQFAALCLLVLGTSASLGQETEWLKQFGTPGFDSGRGIARHSTGIYVTGHQGALPGQIQDPSVASGFLRKYDPSGNEAWVREFAYGTSSTTPFAIAVDDTGVYVGGSSGGTGAFVQKYTHSGQPEWTHFFASTNGATKMVIGWALAVHPTGIYMAGESTLVCDAQFECFSNALVSRLDLAGNELWVRIAGQPFVDSLGVKRDATGKGIAVDATGVYVTGALGTADMRRFDFNGNPTGNFGTGTIWGAGVTLDGSGVYVAGLPCPPCQFEGSIRKFHRNGTVHWTRELPEDVDQANAIASDGDNVYVTGMVYHNFPEGPINAYVFKHNAEGQLVSSDEFGAEPGSDDGYGIAVDASGVYVTGQTTGAFPDHASTPNGDTFVIKRNDNVAPQVRAFSLGDINHDGRPELALVGHDPDTQTAVNWVVIKDAKSRTTVRTYEVADARAAAHVTAVPDFSGNEAPEIALLSGSSHRAYVHDSLSGTLLRSVAFATDFASLRVATVPDQNGNGAPELAVLEASGSAAQVEIRDAKGGAFIRLVSLAPPQSLEPRDLAILSDINQNGAPELAVLAHSAVAGNPDKVAIRDSMTGQLIRNVSFGTGGDPQQLIIVPDINGNGANELAVRREGSGRIVIKDSMTGLNVSVLTYNPAYRPFELAVVPDFNGNGLPEIAVWGIRATDGRVRVVASDVATGQWLKASYFGTTATVRADHGAVITDISGGGVPELVRVGVRASDGSAVAAFRDALTGAAVGGEVVFHH